MCGTAWPSSPGTYVLLMRADHPVEISPGRLGHYTLPAGHYAYAGSARGPGGLRARLARHLRPAKTLRWHIDYLTAQVPVIAVLTDVSGENRECASVQTLLALPGTVAIVPGFGSSDCRSGCPAHLVLLPGDTAISELQSAAQFDNVETILGLLPIARRP